MNDSQKIVEFDSPEDVSTIDVIYEILDTNGLGLGEDPATWPDGTEEETKELIIRDAAITLVQKLIPEDQVVTLLQNHLETSLEVAEKVVSQIKEKLVPYGSIIDSESGEIVGGKKKSFQEQLLEKIKNDVKTPLPEKEAPPASYVKNIGEANVEKNAAAINKAGNNTITQKRTTAPQPKPVNPPPAPQKATPQTDQYKEPIE